MAALLRVDEGWLAFGIAKDEGMERAAVRTVSENPAATIVAGFIQLSGGMCALPDDDDPKRDFVDLYCIVRARQRMVSCALAEMEGQEGFRDHIAWASPRFTDVLTTARAPWMSSVLLHALRCREAVVGSEMPPILELGTVSNCSNDGSCRLRSNTTDLCKPLAGLAGPEDRFDFTVKPGDLLVQSSEAGIKLGEHRPEQTAQLRYPFFRNCAELPAGTRDRLGKCNPAIQQKAAHLCHQYCAVVYKALLTTSAFGVRSLARGGRAVHPINWWKKYRGLMPSDG